MILVTHDIARGLALADQVAIQCRGRIVWQAARDGLTADALTETYRRAVTA